MKNTELNLIPVFVAIYEEQSLSSAASRLGISQPAVSKALKRLREIYDDSLFHRNASGVEPTTFANDIYPALATSLKNFTSTLEASRDFNPKTSTKTFSIASVSAANYAVLPELLVRISKIAPKVSLEVHPLFTEDHESDLRLQRYDLVIDRTRSETPTLKVREIFREKLYVVVANNHPRITGDTITTEQYLAEQHVVMSQWQTRKSFFNEKDFPEFGKRKIMYRAAGEVDMLPAISQTDAIGIITHSTFNKFAVGLDVKALMMPFGASDYGLSMVWHPSRNSDAAHQWLRQQIIKIASQVN
ncbi:LysR family transcriptional regulator [Vibrio mediterranei]|uniref:LysR family transcriptional regulator n=1 Tax=Vibrio mediterranei TaxID=689 RepID=A0AAN1FKD7_9VIBR|nr:LysR family transcriptional regulator [Vibrio mediterranei]ASI92256.1 LysR family transcriptional regulator [Vibrio mediterranei]